MGLIDWTGMEVYVKDSIMMVLNSSAQREIAIGRCDGNKIGTEFDLSHIVDFS